jgi:hypothetical protein
VWVIRAQAARENWFHLVALIEREGELVLASSIVGKDDLEVVRPAPVYRPAEKLLHEGREVNGIPPGRRVSRGKANEDRAQ